MTYILLYRGPTTPAGASHEGWPEWFAQVGDALIDIGSPMLNGHTLRADGSLSDDATDLNGYSLVKADDFEAVREFARDHPFLQASGENSIEIFEVPRKDT